MNTPITHPTALGDQLAAASSDAQRTLAKIATAGHAALIHTTGNAWLAEQAATLVTALTTGTGHACAHLGPAPRVIHAAVWAPGRVTCPACVAALRPSPTEDATCDRCRRHVQLLHGGAAAFGPVILAYGLCRRCVNTVGLTPTDNRRR